MPREWRRMQNNVTRGWSEWRIMRGEYVPIYRYSLFVSHYSLHLRHWKRSINDANNIFKLIRFQAPHNSKPAAHSCNHYLRNTCISLFGSVVVFYGQLCLLKVKLFRYFVRRPLNYLHFRLLLQNRLMDFDETWYGWSTQGPLQVLLFFGQIRPGADPGRGKNRSRGVPFFRKLLLQTGRLQQQTECIAVI